MSESPDEPLPGLGDPLPGDRRPDAARDESAEQPLPDPLDDDREAPPGDPLPGLGQPDAEQSDRADEPPPGDPDESDASTDALPVMVEATVEAEPDTLPVVAPGRELEARQNALQTLPAAPPGLSAYLGRLESNVDEQGRGRIRWGWGALVVTLVVVILAGTGYFIEQSRNSANVAFSPPLQFGIYPGGPVGTVNITDSPVAENPAQRLAALKDLRATNSGGGPRPFVVRLYESFTGRPSVDSWTGTGANASTDGQITEYSENGFDIDLVVRYEPVTYTGISTVQSYLTFIRQLVQRYGPNPNFRYLQIGNEVNQTQAPTSSDGAYGGAVQALAYGVEAASQEAGRDSYPIQVGFNWAYATGSGIGQAMWTFIKSQGLAFQKSVSWVGLDDYPGSFSDLSTSPGRTGPTLVRGIAVLRSLMVQSGLPYSVTIHISETGYPTGPGRSRASQVVAVNSLVNSVNAIRKEDGVSDFEWFDLRDSNSKIQNKQEQYGLMTDSYKAKPAYQTYKRLISTLGP
ncbi:MAG TPA: hypothetical protein VHW93_10620 [Acidimicrobiales bacterium]|nr:hypothetical protein [Acidimicrobiales bacterium]